MEVLSFDQKSFYLKTQSWL